MSLIWHLTPFSLFSGVVSPQAHTFQAVRTMLGEAHFQYHAMDETSQQEKTSGSQVSVVGSLVLSKRQHDWTSMGLQSPVTKGWNIHKVLCHHLNKQLIYQGQLSHLHMF